MLGFEHVSAVLSIRKSCHRFHDVTTGCWKPRKEDRLNDGTVSVSTQTVKKAEEESI
jgi:hypothetical protein